MEILFALCSQVLLILSVRTSILVGLKIYTYWTGWSQTIVPTLSMTFQTGCLIAVVPGKPDGAWKSVRATYVVISVLSSRHY